MCETAYIFHISFLRVLHKKKLFIILLLSLTTVMIVPFIGTSLIESLVTHRNSLPFGYTDTAYAYRVQTPLLEPDALAAIRDNICETGVMVNLYNEYVILHPDTPEQSGRFLEVNALDAEALSVFYPSLDASIQDSFAANRFVCIADYRTAGICSLHVGDTLSVRGNSYEILAISTEQNSSFICIPYRNLSSGIDYQHTIYLFYDSVIPKETVLSSMRSVFPDAVGGDAVSLTEAYDTKSDMIGSTLLVIMAITLSYTICAVINITAIRYGDIKINQHDYAVSLALGSTKSGLLLSILFENLILTPPSLILNAGIFFLIRHILPFPYRLTISPVTVLCNFLFAFFCSCLVAWIVAARMTAESCAAMLKEL